MSEKNYDKKGRWRNITIGFRVSPEENADINRRVKLSGLTKQDYVCRRCQEREITVMGNPRVYKALKVEMEAIRLELSRIAPGEPIDDDLRDIIRMVCSIVAGMNGDKS